MAVGLKSPKKLLPVNGLRLATIYAGIKKTENDDLTLIELEQGSSVAAVFTKNKFSAAPVQISKQHIQIESPRYLLINAGNANAGTGDQGYQDALDTCSFVAKQCGVKQTAVLPFSTGVIAQRLDVNKFSEAIPHLFEGLTENNWVQAANAIMTTDTVAKGISKLINLNGNEYTVTGISKGSGMICPDMATLLAYIGTDLPLPEEQLQRVHQNLVELSFNAITVDGDTSTNDACILISTNKGKPVSVEDDVLIDTLLPIYTYLAQAIIRDAEGATKFVTLDVSGAASNQDAKEIAYTVAHSPLVKTALFASDANWGRILAAIGRSSVEDLDVDKIDLYLNNVALLKQGKPTDSYTEEQGSNEMAKDEIQISINLNLANGSARVWTSDLSHDYVSINADYRS